MIQFFIVLLSSVAFASGNMDMNLAFSVGSQSMKVTGSFKPDSRESTSYGYKIDYTLVGSTLLIVPTNGFSSTAVEIMRNASYTATQTVTDAGGRDLKIVIDTHTNDTQDVFKPPRLMTLTQSSNLDFWQKDEGVIKTTTTGGGTGCKIEPSGKQPMDGVYAVVLTKPSPCDFKMPTVKVSRDIRSGLVEFPIGTYWQLWPQVCHAAHDFPTVAVATEVLIDNGFILIQPDHKSYLLVDSGAGQPTAGEYRNTETITQEISRSLGFGYTTLLKPNPGSPDDGFATATLFKRGSVVAIYDDTPDMGGTIDVKALVDDVHPVELKLNWHAKSDQG